MRFVYVKDEGVYTIMIDGVTHSYDGSSENIDDSIYAIQGYDDGSFELEFTDSSKPNKQLFHVPDYVNLLIKEWELSNAEEAELNKTLEERLEVGSITESEYDVMKSDELQEWRHTAVVSKFQAKAALYQSGMLETVQTHMETADPMAQMAWQDAQEFRRYSPTMKALAVELGMTEEELDDLFRLAATIEA